MFGGHLLQVGRKVALILLFLILGQVLEALDVLPAVLAEASAVGEVLNGVICHSVVVGQLVAFFDVLEGNIAPVGPVEPDAAVGVARMVDVSAYFAKPHPLVHVHLAGMHVIWAIERLHLADIHDISLFERFQSIKA